MRNSLENLIGKLYLEIFLFFSLLSKANNFFPTYSRCIKLYPIVFILVSMYVCVWIANSSFINTCSVSDVHFSFINCLDSRWRGMIHFSFSCWKWVNAGHRTYQSFGLVWGQGKRYLSWKCSKMFEICSVRLFCYVDSWFLISCS